MSSAKGSASASSPAALPPGSVIGIVGGGQLGRMLALAAYGLGFRVHVYAETEEDPAAHVTPFRTFGRLDDA
ncbi:MAG: hypothetical protein AAGF19_12215, partial [Pseudomonadota bacterium]